MFSVAHCEAEATLQPPPYPQRATEGFAIQEQTQTAGGHGQNPPGPAETRRDPGATWEEGEPPVQLCITNRI